MRGREDTPCPYRMKRFVFFACLPFFVACASNPDKIDAAYVSPLEYKDYTCNQLQMEMDQVEKRTSTLYRRLARDRRNDNWQTGVGLVLFWPILFALEGGDGPEAAEYAQLKGTYRALQENKVTKNCGFESRSPEQVIKDAAEAE